MEISITVRVVSDGAGYFVGRAEGFRGVIASGRTEDEVVERVARSWVAIYRAKQSKAPVKAADNQIFNGQAHERSFRLQVAN